MVIESVQSLFPSNGVVLVIFNCIPRFHQDESETYSFEVFCVRFVSEFGRLGIASKHTL